MIGSCEFLEIRHYSKGEEIRLKSGHVNEVFFLKRGALKIVCLKDSGEEIIKDLVNEGEIFGILGLMGAQNRDDYAVAIVDSQICVMDAITLRNMTDINPKLNKYLFRMAGALIQKLESKLESLTINDAETRIKEFIISYLKSFGVEHQEKLMAKNLLSNEEIGWLTCTSRQTVNKVLNNLRSEGYIDFDKNVLKIELKRIKN
ncbi:Crp/Fnr family transcriptional regulator [Flagellimonas sp. 2504JD4-2]